nr:hypothetical protein [Tanacetum cinerariifolium]
MFGQFMKINTACSSSSSLPSNTVPNPQEDLKVITTRSDVTLTRPLVSPPPPSTEMPEVTKDTVQPSTENIQPSVAQTRVPIDEPVVAPKPKPTILYPSRANIQNLREKDDNLALKFVEIFRNLHFELSFADALLHMPKFALMFKSLLNNKEKLFDLATDSACEEYVQKVLGFFDTSKSSNPTPISDPIIALSSPFLTPFEGGDFILKEIKTFLRTPDELSNLDDDYYDMEGDILYL